MRNSAYALTDDASGKGTSPRISVIIPVYNVEPYIGRCVESLQAQTFKDLEFVFVDDCSPDGSMAAVEAWAAEDPRVRVIRNERNLGEGPSRNRGIEAARGDYLASADPDDYVSPDFYELLYAAAASGGGHDIAKGTCRKVSASGAAAAPPSRLNDAIERDLSKGHPLFSAFRYEHCSAIYRRGLFADGGVRYGASGNGADTTFLFRCCRRTSDLVV